MTEQWLTIIEYARACNVSDMTVRRRIRNGKLNAILREGKYLIPLVARPTPAVTSVSAVDQNNGNRSSNHEQRNNSLREPAILKTYPVAHSSIHGVDVSTTSSIDSVPDSNPARVPFPSQVSTRSTNGNQVVQRKNLEHSTDNLIPKALSIPVSKHETVSFEAAALIDFCESMARRLDKSEEAARKEFAATQGELEAKLQCKELEIIRLKQEVEDLQLLVSIIDRSK